MTEDSTAAEQYQLELLLQELSVDEGKATWKDVFLPFNLVMEIAIEDWKHYSVFGKVLFLWTLSPLLWLLSAFQPKI